MANGLDIDADGFAYYGQKWNEMKWNGSCELHTFYWQRAAHEWFDNKSENRKMQKSEQGMSAMKRGTAAVRTHTQNKNKPNQTNMKRKTLAMNFYNHQTMRRVELNQSNRMQSRRHNSNGNCYKSTGSRRSLAGRAQKGWETEGRAGSWRQRSRQPDSIIV